MVTIKAFTALSQSKKLAEILPLESADMWYHGHYSPWKSERIYDEEPCLSHSKYPNWDNPCWSLAALISVLPLFIEFKGNKYYLRFMKEYVEYANDEISITGRCLYTIGNDNLVDACVAMIEELHELKML